MEENLSIFKSVFSLNEEVHLLGSTMKGKIKEICFSYRKPIIYKVKYFAEDGVYYDAWMEDDEIETLNKVEKNIEVKNE